MSTQFKIPRLMAILNLTPDSFSGDGITNQKKIINQAEKFLSEGADVIDIGAESSRPGSKELSAEEELHRILPVIDDILSLTKNISIDTYHSKTAEVLLGKAPLMINSIWGIKKDQRLAELTARYNSKIIIMHNSSDNSLVTYNQKTGSSYSPIDSKRDIIELIRTDLSNQINQAKDLGLNENQIIIDPGIGFGKTIQENFLIIKKIPELKEMSYPILIGASRKSFLAINNKYAVSERLENSITAAALAAMKGADYLRVHDLAATKKALETVEAICNA